MHIKAYLLLSTQIGRFICRYKALFQNFITTYSYIGSCLTHDRRWRSARCARRQGARQCLYFCTSKASNYLYFCTSKASKLRAHTRSCRALEVRRTHFTCFTGTQVPDARAPVTQRARRHRALALGLVLLLHTSAYVSIRAHTQAYVSICRHTSAYAGIELSRSAWCCSRSVVSTSVFVLL